MALPIPDRSFWEKCLVDFEELSGSWKETSKQAKLVNFLCQLPEDNLVYLGRLLGVPSDAAESPRHIAVRVAAAESGLTLLCLKEFYDRKVTAVELYWTYEGYKAPSSVERLTAYAKLVTLYKTDPKVLQDIFVLNAWLSRASGVTYISQERVDTSRILSRLDVFAEVVQEHADRLFRLAGACQTPDGLLIMLYRQDPARLLEAFAEPIRYIGAQAVLLRLNPGQPVSVLEIRTQTQSAREAVVRAVSLLSDTSWVERPDEAFSEYNDKTIQEVIQRGGLDRALEVTGIEFGNVPLASERTTLTLQADSDIADSLVGLGQFSDTLTLVKSLLDLRRLRVRIPGEANWRWIESRELKTGEVTFVLDDKGLTPDIVQQIATGFEKRFLLPLNKPINHSKFFLGRARLLDFLFSAEYREVVPEYQHKVLEDLHLKNLITYHPGTVLECKICRTESKDSTTTECQSCGGQLVPGRPITRLSPEIGNVEKEIRRIIGLVPGWKVYAKGKVVTIDGQGYPVFSIRNKDLSNDELLVHIVTALPTEKTVSRFQSYSAPLFMVYVGKAAVGKQRDRLAQLHGETLGEIMAEEETGSFPKLAQSLKDALTNGEQRLLIAARRARERVRLLLSGRTPEEYDDTSFEDDCWALLRSVLPSTVKWGSDKLNKAVPDGFVDYAYAPILDDLIIRAWTYDAKLTERETGYDLKQAEKRKIVEYMTSTAVNARLKKYTERQGFTGHLLISNRFNLGDIPRIQDYVFKHAPKLVGKVRVRFLEVEALLALSEYIDLRSKEFQVRNVALLSALDRLLLGDDPLITINRVRKMVEEVLKEEPERDPLDTDKLANEIAQ